MTNQNPIKCTWSTATLGVSKTCHSGIKPKSLAKDFFNVLCSDRVEVGVMSTFRDDYDCLSLSYFTVLVGVSESSRMMHQ